MAVDIFDGTAQQLNRNWATTVLASAVRAATNNSPDLLNYNWHGADFIIDMTAVPGTDTVTPKVQGYDQASGKWYDLLVGAAIVGVSTVVLRVAPGITPATNLAVASVLPFRFRLLFTHSAASNFTYSVGVNLSL